MTTRHLSAGLALVLSAAVLTAQQQPPAPARESETAWDVTRARGVTRAIDFVTTKARG